MDVTSLWTLQVMMFFLAGAGAILKKSGALDDHCKNIITNLVLDFILPCNIINSFRTEFDISILKRFAMVSVVAICMQIISYSGSKVFYNNKEDARKRILRYCTIVSNSSLLGFPVVNSVYGSAGVMYASIFIIPMRIMMWSAGIACFTESPDFMTVVKKIAKHPCIIALYIGIPMLIFQKPLGIMYSSLLGTAPAMLAMILKIVVGACDQLLKSAGGCTTTLTMVLIGTMLAEIKASDLMDKDVILITVIRQGFLPLAALLLCRLLHVDPLLTGVSVMLTGMPVGSTSAILAAKYGCDYRFGTKCVVISTLTSMITIPLWCMYMGI